MTMSYKKLFKRGADGRPWYLTRNWLVFGTIFWPLMLLMLVAAVRYDVDDHVVARNFHAVEEGSIYRSGQISRFMIEDVLVEHGIGKIIFMSDDKPGRLDVEAEARVAAELGIERFNFPMAGDGTGKGKGLGNAKQYVLAVVEMHRAQQNGKRVLIHCHTGSQRTGGAVALYRILVQGWDPEAARAEMLKYGHHPDDNPYMIPFINKHMGYIAEQLVGYGVLHQVPDPLPQIRFED